MWPQTSSLLEVRGLLNTPLQNMESSVSQNRMPSPFRLGSGLMLLVQVIWTRKQLPRGQTGPEEKMDSRSHTAQKDWKTRTHRPSGFVSRLRRCYPYDRKHRYRRRRFLDAWRIE